MDWQTYAEYRKISRHMSPCILASGCRQPVLSPDVVRLALVQRLHEALQLLPEASPHAVELVGALADPPRPRWGRRLCRLCILKDDPAQYGSSQQTTFAFLRTQV